MDIQKQVGPYVEYYLQNLGKLDQSLDSKIYRLKFKRQRRPESKSSKLNRSIDPSINANNVYFSNQQANQTLSVEEITLDGIRTNTASTTQK